MIDVERWPKYWGILFSVYTSDEIRGKVRLNKFLSLLQREGFSIKNKFIIAEMGPYDKNVSIQAEKLYEQGLLSIEKKDIGHDSPLFVYKKTNKGIELTENEIIPLLEKLPDQVAFQTSCIRVRDFVQYNKTNTMIDNIHKQLFLDDPKQFISELTKIKNKIGKLLNEIEKISVDYCAIYQDYLGFYEFTNESLKNIMCDFIGDKYIGKNNILYNAIKFIERFNSLYSDFKNNQFNKCLNANKCLEYPCPFRDKFLNHRFHCIEYNSELYGINKAIDHRNFNFNDIFENDIVDNQGENNTEDSENEHTYPLCY